MPGFLLGYNSYAAFKKQTVFGTKISLASGATTLVPDPSGSLFKARAYRENRMDYINAMARKSDMFNLPKLVDWEMAFMAYSGLALRDLMLAAFGTMVRSTSGGGFLYTYNVANPVIDAGTDAGGGNGSYYGRALTVQQVLNSEAGAPSFTVASVTTTTGSPNISGTGALFANVFPGYGVTGAGITAGTYIVSIDRTTNNTAVLSLNATASATVTLTFQPVAGWEVESCVVDNLELTFEPSKVTMAKFSGVGCNMVDLVAPNVVPFVAPSNPHTWEQVQNAATSGFWVTTGASPAVPVNTNGFLASKVTFGLSNGLLISPSLGQAAPTYFRKPDRDRLATWEADIEMLADANFSTSVDSRQILSGFINADFVNLIARSFIGTNDVLEVNWSASGGAAVWAEPEVSYNGDGVMKFKTKAQAYPQNVATDAVVKLIAAS